MLKCRNHHLMDRRGDLQMFISHTWGWSFCWLARLAAPRVAGNSIRGNVRAPGFGLCTTVSSFWFTFGKYADSEVCERFFWVCFLTVVGVVVDDGSVDWGGGGAAMSSCYNSTLFNIFTQKWLKKRERGEGEIINKDNTTAYWIHQH